MINTHPRFKGFDKRTGERFNTAAAALIGEAETPNGYERLYRTKRGGGFFIHRTGGAGTSYEVNGDRAEGVRGLTQEEARAWADEYILGNSFSVKKPARK